MDKKIISDIANNIVKEECALFAGSGITLKGGGVTWLSLIDFLREKFNYDSPLKDEWQIITDIFQKNDGEKVYNAIKEKLIDIKIPENILPLTGLSWFSVFTTNYDLALENALKENQKKTVKTVLTGNELELEGIQSDIHCVKLMGSLDRPYNTEGSMVLTRGDLSIARDKRSKIFDKLESYAANISFLFLGYSFNDDLFFEILDRLITNLGQSEKTYYALFKEKPDEEMSYRLDQYGIIPIIGDIDIFTEKLYHQVSIRDPKDFSIKRVPIGDQIIPIDKSKIKSFLNLYPPIFFSDWNKDTNVKDFLKGKTNSFKPFDLGWHYHREEINKVVNTVISSSSKEENNIIRIIGELGHGRTFTILASVYELVKNKRALAIELQENVPVQNRIPSLDEINNFYEEVCRSSKQIDDDFIPEMIVFWARFNISNNNLIRFRNLSDSLPQNIYLIFEDSPNKINKFSIDLENIQLKDNISIKEKSELIKYIQNTIKNHKLSRKSDEEIDSILMQEKSFLDIMYRSLDPSRRSINEMVKDEIQELKNEIIRKIICYCALSNAVNLDIPVTNVRKALSFNFGKTFSYSEIFNIVDKEGKNLVKERNHGNNYYFSIYHRKIAYFIVDLMGQSLMDECLITLAKSCNLESNFEANFIGNLLINKGVNQIFEEEPTPFSYSGLEHSLTELSKKQPARPILHHLARLKMKKNIENEDIIPLLNKAIAQETDTYAMYEDEENVLTTLAGVKWERKKEELAKKSINDPDLLEITNLFVRARKNEENAHAYHKHAKILYELSTSKLGFEKYEFIKESINVLNRGIKSKVDDKLLLEKTLIEYLDSIDISEAKSKAEKLLEEKNDGSGYYILSNIEYYNRKNKTKASLYLDYAMNGDKYPPEVIALKIKILLDDKYPDYEKILDYVKELESKFYFEDTWESLYHKAVIYTINGYEEKAKDLFLKTKKMAPYRLKTDVRLFWMENGSRKIFEGKIGSQLETYRGWIYSHGIDGWGDIFFNPNEQNKNISPGYFVKFELGFNAMGPIAFDLRISRGFNKNS